MGSSVTKVNFLGLVEEHSRDHPPPPKRIRYWLAENGGIEDADTLRLLSDSVVIFRVADSQYLALPVCPSS